jgi:hypothetical protein
MVRKWTRKAISSPPLKIKAGKRLGANMVLPDLAGRTTSVKLTSFLRMANNNGVTETAAAEYVLKAFSNMDCSS